MPMVRTQDEIVARIEEVASQDWMGDQRSDLIRVLDFEHAKPYLKDGVDATEWDKLRAEQPDPIEQARDYLEFAMGKASGHRGLSSDRSVSHYRSWAWLSGDEAFIRAVEDSDYPMYGAPVLRAVARALGPDTERFWNEHADAELNRMADGLPCVADCEEGCAQ